MKTRPHLLAAFVAGLCAFPLSASAQQPGKVWRVGILASIRRPDPPDTDNYDEFTRGMRQLGYVEGRNLAIEWRFADGKYGRLPGLAAELVRLRVDVMVTEGTPAALAAQDATASIPVVFVGVGDAVGAGLVKSLARPGGNSTGISNLALDLNVKQMEMLLRVAPGVSQLGLLSNPANPAHASGLKMLQTAAKQTGVRLLVAQARTEEEIETAFAVFGRERVQALVVVREAFFFQQRHQIFSLAAKHHLPSVGGGREYEAGCLISYGQSRADFFYRASTYVDRILKGARPGDLPVEQPTKLELVINQRTARALGITVPPELLLLADKVIE